MSLKQRIEENAVVFVLSVVSLSFASGWAANYAVQSASGRTSVSLEDAKLIENFLKEKAELRAKNTDLEQSLSEVRRTMEEDAERFRKTQANSSVPEKPVVAGSTSKAKQTSSLKTPTSSSLPIAIGDIYLTGGFAQQVQVGSKVVALVDYIVKSGSTVQVWIHHSDSECSGGFQPSGDVQGSGRLERYFTADKPCIVKRIEVEARQGDAGDVVQLKSVPVHIEFVK